MKNYEMKKECIMAASEDIVKYLDDVFAIDVDVYALAELINLNLGFVFDAIDETFEEFDEDYDS